MQVWVADKLQEIVAHEPERVAGWGVEHEGNFSGWVSLQGDEPVSHATQALLDEADAQGLTIDLKNGATHMLCTA